jgi:MATE family multidrug resistance protein
MMVISAILYFACVTPLMAAFGNHGLWLALLASFIFRGITLGLRYPALERSAVPLSSR